MTTTENPFEHRRPVAATEAIGREAEVARLEALAEEGTNARLIAPPGYGKTSLLRRVQQRLDRAGWAPVHVPLLGVTTVAALVGRVAGSLTRTLGPFTPGRFPDLSEELADESERLSPTADLAYKSDRLQVLLGQLPEFAARDGRRVYVVFDDFDELDALGRGWDELLRHEIEHHGHEVSYVFAGARRDVMQYAFSGTYRALRGLAVPVLLEPFAAQSLATYVADRFATTEKRVTPPALDALDKLCEGHPRRAMAAARALWDATEKDAGAEQWADARAVLMEEAAGELQAAWRVFDPYERAALVTVATGRSPFFRRSELGPGSILGAAQEWLCGGGILARSGTRWRTVDPLLAEWIRNGCATW